jgi:hypothetical protein
MTCLRSLTLLNSGSSNILEDCIFNLDFLACDFPYKKSLRKFLEHQSSIAHICLLGLYDPSESFESTCIPNLTRVTTPYSWLPHLFLADLWTKSARLEFYLSEIPSIWAIMPYSTIPIRNSRSSSLFHTRIMDISSHRFSPHLHIWILEFTTRFFACN